MPHIQPSHTPTVVNARRKMVAQEKKLISVGEINGEKLLIRRRVGFWRFEKQAFDGKNEISRGVETEERQVAGGSVVCGVKKTEPRWKRKEREEFT